MKNESIARYGTAIFVISSIIGSYFFSRPKKRGITTQLDKKLKIKTDRNLMTPANETFGVAWPVLYAGAIALAVHQSLPSQHDNGRYNRSRPWLILCYTLNAAFGYFFSKSNKPNRLAAAITTIAMLPASVMLHRQLEIGTSPVPEPENSIHKIMGMYTGWLTAASAVSINTVILGTSNHQGSDQARTIALWTLPITFGASLYASSRLNDPYYLITVIAALAGVAVKQHKENKDISQYAAALATSLTGVVASKIARLK